MTVEDLINEMFSAGDLNAAMEWDETPSDVKDSHTGEPSKLPIDTEILRKKKKKIKITRREALNTLTIAKENI